MTSSQRREALAALRDAEDEQGGGFYRETKEEASPDHAAATATIAVAHAILALDSSLQQLTEAFRKESSRTAAALEKLGEAYRAAEARITAYERAPSPVDGG